MEHYFRIYPLTILIQKLSELQLKPRKSSFIGILYAFIENYYIKICIIIKIALKCSISKSKLLDFGEHEI